MGQKSPGDLRRLAVPHTTVKDHQLVLLQKTCEEWIIIKIKIKEWEIQTVYCLNPLPNKSVKSRGKYSSNQLKNDWKNLPC